MLYLLLCPEQDQIELKKLNDRARDKAREAQLKLESTPRQTGNRFPNFVDYGKEFVHFHLKTADLDAAEFLANKSYKEVVKSSLKFYSKKAGAKRNTIDYFNP